MVDFNDGIKAGTIFTENANTVTAQAWATNPSASGTITLNEVLVTPVKLEYHDSFNYETLRSGRWNRSMKAGAWEIVSDEFNKQVLSTIAPYISQDIETQFWSGVTSTTQTAIAALTAGTAQTSIGAAEKTVAAAMTAGLFDGVLARLYYNNGGVGKRYKVAGVSGGITSSNIADEYGKAYAAINPVMLQGIEKPFIYAPRSHKQLINIYNISQTYRDKFQVDISADKYFYLGVEIKFVPLPENVLIVATPSMIKWCTDTMDDLNMVQIDKYPAPRKDFFYDVVFTIFAHVVNQKYFVVYTGA